MEPVSFPEANVTLGAPPDMKNCEPVKAFQGFQKDGLPVTVVCWKLTGEEINQLITSGKLWLIIAGHSAPPIDITAKTPFQ